MPNSIRQDISTSLDLRQKCIENRGGFTHSDSVCFIENKDYFDLGFIGRYILLYCSTFSDASTEPGTARLMISYRSFFTDSSRMLKIHITLGKHCASWPVTSGEHQHTLTQGDSRFTFVA